jgi:hypothetical protein
MPQRGVGGHMLVGELKVGKRAENCLFLVLVYNRDIDTQYRGPI